MTLNDYGIRKLTYYQKQMLVDHIDGRVPISTKDPVQDRTREALLKLRLLTQGPTGGGNQTPKWTELTSHGRYALALTLSIYAETLVRAGFIALERAEALTTSQMLVALRSQTHPAKSPNLKNSANPASSDSSIGR